MTPEDFAKTLPLIKQVSEIGLGILGNITVLGIAIYFIVYLTKTLKSLTIAVESIVETNKAATVVLNCISGHLQAHDQRASDIQSSLSSAHDKINLLATKQDVTSLAMLAMNNKQ